MGMMGGAVGQIKSLSTFSALSNISQRTLTGNIFPDQSYFLREYLERRRLQWNRLFWNRMAQGIFLRNYLTGSFDLQMPRVPDYFVLRREEKSVPYQLSDEQTDF